MEKDDFVEFDFSYIDQHLDMIKSKIINRAKISIFNGFVNKIYTIQKNDNEFKYFHSPFDDTLVEILYEDIIKEIILFYQTSIGKITIIYRIFTNSFNSKTNGEFRELWGDVLYIDAYTFKFTSKNIYATNLSNIVLDLELTEEEIEVFGRVEEYVFKDNNDNIIMGIDLL
jgi:hypothetical protein